MREHVLNLDEVELQPHGHGERFAAQVGAIGRRIGARRLGYRDHAGNNAVERLMKHYFLTAKSVGELTRFFCTAVEAQHVKRSFIRLPSIGLRKRELEGFGLDGGRLNIGACSIGGGQSALDKAIAYMRERKAFGQTIGSFQATRFTLAEVRGEVDVARAYIDRCAQALDAGELTPEDAATAKWWCTDLQGRAIDRCLQLFGGYGYMSEYPIARAYADARVTRIYGGANEIMKEIVGRSMGL